MSGKSAKLARKEQEAKVKESQDRQQAFLKEVRESSAKYRCDLVAALEYRNTQVVATIVVVDVKEKYEAMTAEAKKQEEARKLAETKIQPQNPQDAPTPTVPKLEV